MMSILKAEIVSAHAPLWVGFQHFLLTILVGMLSHMVFLSMFFSLFLGWAWGENLVAILLYFVTILFFSFATSSWIMRKKIANSANSKQAWIISFFLTFFGILLFLFLPFLASHPSSPAVIDSIPGSPPQGLRD